MCGIVGIWDYKNRIGENLLKEMRDTLRHRGPDDDGLFIDENNNVGFGFRRLSIIDLSAGGHQPMERDGLVTVYNGEIYNYLEIKNELKSLGVNFTSDSDTEVMLQAFKKWGKEAVHKFRGMFAFALWDKNVEKLTLYRDRAGVKPLYYYTDNSKLIFASEIKAIIKHPEVKKELNFDALANFFQLGFIPSPLSIFKNIYKLEAGHFIEIDKSGKVTKEKYWDINDYALPVRDRDEGSLMREIEEILTESFNLRMVADVPVGIFLSGGIDSSLVTALLKKNNNTLKTFTIGFEEAGHNEAEHAKKIAMHLGTDHHELYLTSSKAQEIIPKLPEMFDEPMGDASAIPTYLVSEFARSKVTVALSGDGGDELFCGYGNKYMMVEQSYNKYASVRFISKHFSVAGRYARMQKKTFSKSDIKRLLLYKPSRDYINNYWKPFEGLKNFEPITQLQIFDFKTHMAEDILTKVDRASMATSLEAREPFLDPKVIKYAISLPSALKRKNNIDKYILKKILYKYVPQDLVDRPKSGFGMPIGDLLKGGQKKLVEQYLNGERIKKEGILDSDIVREEKGRFWGGQVHGRGIWRMITFQMWKEYWGL